MMPQMMPKEEMARRNKARRPDVTIDDVVMPEARMRRKAMAQGARDEAMQEAAGAAYDKAMPSPERYAKGGKVGGASKRADGIAKQGRTRGKMI